MYNWPFSPHSSLYSRAFFLLLAKKKANFRQNLAINQFLLKLFQTQKLQLFHKLLLFPKLFLIRELKIVLEKHLPLIWMNFLLIIIEDGYFPTLLAILTNLEKTLLAKLKIKTAFIYSSVLLNAKQLKAVENKLITQTPTTIKIVNKIDKKLLVGAMLEFGDKVINNSYQKQLHDLKMHLLKKLVV